MPEAFVCGGLRTPIGRYGGALAAVRTDDLASIPIAALLAASPGLDPHSIDDVVLGCANQAGEDNRNVARMALLLAGLPDTIAGSTVNRLCGSGLDAVAIAARAVRSGEADLLLAGGVEGMSRAPFVLPKATSAFDRSPQLADSTLGWRFVNSKLAQAHGVDSMGQTAENVARERRVGREDQDAFAWRSQTRAGAAAARLAEEIVEVRIPGPKGTVTVVDRDEHPRPDTTLERLAKLAPAFAPDGSVTAGNSSGINDGACALWIASEAGARRAGLEPIARIAGAAVAGVPPRLMGLGPVPATAKLLRRLGLSIRGFDVVEINEAFASQALAVLRDLGLPDDAEHVNPNGGAIALGHPLGMSGARLALTAALELRRRGGRSALCTMCVGVGQGIALALERV